MFASLLLMTLKVLLAKYSFGSKRRIQRTLCNNLVTLASTLVLSCGPYGTKVI